MLLKKTLITLGLKAADPLDKPLLTIPGYGDWKLRDAHEAVACIGIPGSGKTTGINSFLNAYLAADFGGAAMSVKPSSAKSFEKVVEDAGRKSDLHVLNGRNGERYNPFDDLTSASDAAALLNELSSLATGLAHFEKKTADSFWPIEGGRLLLHLCELCLAGHRQIDAQLLTNLLREFPNTAGEFENPQWRDRSQVWSIIASGRKSGSNNLRQACDYVEFEFCRFEPKMQASILAMARSTLGQLLRDPLASIFAGKSTVTMRDVFGKGQIIAIGLPAQQSKDGQVANAIVQFCFCQRAKAEVWKRDSFFLSDECQVTATEELMSSLAVLREHRVSVILATQSLGTLNLRTGKDAGQALLNLAGTLVFMKQTDPDTREWASKRIGEKTVEREAINKGNGNRSVTYTEEERRRVLERTFQQLAIGECIGVRGDKIWRCSWAKNGISGWFKISVHRSLRKRLKR